MTTNYSYQRQHSVSQNLKQRASMPRHWNVCFCHYRLTGLVWSWPWTLTYRARLTIRGPHTNTMHGPLPSPPVRSRPLESS